MPRGLPISQRDRGIVSIEGPSALKTLVCQTNTAQTSRAVYLLVILETVGKTLWSVEKYTGAWSFQNFLWKIIKTVFYEHR